MSILSTSRVLLLSLVLLAVTASVRSADNWPVKTPVDLSSNFGEYRQNRFHAGVDVRTGGKIGTRIYSAVSGYVWRIKMSYNGYGKGLYIKGDDGHYYVYGHLHNFATKIDRVVKRAQLSSKRYVQDLYLPKDSVPIAGGEFLGLSGRTGGTAPHLHFEKRSPDNFPINPVTHGFRLKDMTPPAFSSIIFRMTDDKSLFDNASRSLELRVARRGSSTVYTPDRVLYFNHPVGILTECFDRIRPGGMHLTPYTLELYVDDTVRYRVVLDSLDFNAQRSVNLEYDHIRAANGNKDVRRLYNMPGNNYGGSRASTSNGGVVGLPGTIGIGLHRGKIVATDHAGNSNELHFDFIRGPEGFLYRKDSISTDSGSIHLRPNPGINAIPVDSIAIYENVGVAWVRLPANNITYFDNGSIAIDLGDGLRLKEQIARLHVYSQGCTIADLPLSEVFDGIAVNPTLNYEVVEDGIVLKLDVETQSNLKPRVDLCYQSQVLGVEYPRFINVRHYATFIAPQEKYSRLDTIKLWLSDDVVPAAVLPVSIFLVGSGEEEAITAGDGFSLRIGDSHFYTPRYVELRPNDPVKDQLRILPEAFVCSADYQLSFDDPPVKKSEGICWWDKEDNEWVWLDNIYGHGSVAADVTGGGVFAVFADNKQPVISQLSIKRGLTYFNPQYEISFLLTDDLSGFADDRNIVVELDGQWMIPEYNPETEICKTSPPEPLPNGRHELRIAVTDQAGNVTEQKLHFFVKKDGK